jgi:hypothetical protein
MTWSELTSSSFCYTFFGVLCCRRRLAERRYKKMYKNVNKTTTFFFVSSGVVCHFCQWEIAIIISMNKWMRQKSKEIRGFKIIIIMLISNSLKVNLLMSFDTLWIALRLLRFFSWWFGRFFFHHSPSPYAQQTTNNLLKWSKRCFYKVIGSSHCVSAVSRWKKKLII